MNRDDGCNVSSTRQELSVTGLLHRLNGAPPEDMSASQHPEPEHAAVFGKGVLADVIS